MKITDDNDPYWNLMGAIEDMKITGKADSVTIETCEQVLLQLKEMQEELRKYTMYSAEHLVSKNPFRE